MFRKRPPEPTLPPELMIVGLGNPGAEYRGTRHNVGFDVIDRLAEKARIKMGSAKHRAISGQGEIEGTRVVLVKPLTFMNLSGQAVAPLLKEHGLTTDQLLVVADDLDLPVGRLRLKAKGSAGGHNGHKSLINALKTDVYMRLKIGIGKVDKSQTVDHVLGPFDREERDLIADALRTSVEACQAFARGGEDAARNTLEPHNRQFNTKADEVE